MSQYQEDCKREQNTRIRQQWRERVIIARLQFATLIAVVYIVGHFVIKYW